MRTTLFYAFVALIGMPTYSSVALAYREVIGSSSSSSASSSASSSGGDPATTGKCILSNNLFYRVSEAGQSNTLIRFSQAIHDPSCTYVTDRLEDIKMAYLQKAASTGEGAQVATGGIFDCYAKFFPDGSLASPWVGSMGLASTNRQSCEEQNMAAQIRALKKPS